MEILGRAPRAEVDFDDFEVEVRSGATIVAGILASEARRARAEVAHLDILLVAAQVRQHTAASETGDGWVPCRRSEGRRHRSIYGVPARP